MAACTGLRAAAISAGADTASLWLDGEAATGCPPRVAVADTDGAGDAFSAGMLDAISRGMPAGAALRRANAMGALIASSPGALPDWTPAALAGLECQISQSQEGRNRSA